MGMLASIENRVPFLENDILNFAINLPLKYKINKQIGKQILKLVAEKYLPKHIIYRKKQGFPVPWAKYINYNSALFELGFIAKLFNMSANVIKRITAYDNPLLFRLLCIELWGLIYLRKETKENLKEMLCRE